MKIIDVHAHTGKWLFHSRINDSDIPDMLDRFGICKAVFSSGMAIMDDMVEGNRVNYEFILTDSRCYGYVVVNPNFLDESEQELAKYLGREKIVGVKMHPAQFNNPVNSKESKALIKIINSYGLPVLIHTEETQTSRPANILEIAQEFPTNKYIIAHMGNSWWHEALDTASKSDNIYTDIISSWRAFDQIRHACDSLGDHRVLYGSDMTLLDPGISIGMVLSSEIGDISRERIFYGNAMTIFDF